MQTTTENQVLAASVNERVRYLSENYPNETPSYWVGWASQALKSGNTADALAALELVQKAIIAESSARVRAGWYGI